MVDTSQGAAPESGLTKDLLGGIVCLCSFSDLHVHYSLGYLLQRITPAIELNQYRYYEDNGHPIGFCCWARLTNERLQNAKNGELNFPIEDWHGGQNFFFVEFIAPFGHCRTIVRDLRDNIVPKSYRGWSTRGKVLKNPDEGDDLRVLAFSNR